METSGTAEESKEEARGETSAQPAAEIPPTNRLHRTRGYEDDPFLWEMQSLISSLMDFDEADDSNAPVSPITNDLAEMFEKQELDYLQQQGRSPDIDQRSEHQIGRMYAAFEEFNALSLGDFLQEYIFPRVNFHSDRTAEVKMTAAALRLLLIIALTSGDEDSVMKIFEEEDALEAFKKWVTKGAEPLRCYATGLLSLAMSDRNIADIIVNDDLPSVFLRRLRSKVFMRHFEHEKREAKRFLQEMKSQPAQTSGVSLRRLSSNHRPNRGTKRKGHGSGHVCTESTAQTIAPSSSVDEDSKLDNIELSSSTQSTSQQRADDDALENYEPDRAKHEVSKETLRRMELYYVLDVLAKLGEYQEVLGPCIREDLMSTLFILLHSSTDKITVFYALKVVSHLLAHTKFAFSLLELGGLRLLLRLSKTRTSTFHHGVLATCWFAVASLPAVMEKVLSFPKLSTEMLEYCTELLISPQDSTRKEAVNFFYVALSFKRVLDFFDSNDGVYKLLNLMRPGLQPRRQLDRQIAHHACLCLRQYFRTHVALAAYQIRRRVLHHARSSRVSTPFHQALKKLSISKPLHDDDKSTPGNIAVLEKYRYTHLSCLNMDWTPIQQLAHHRGAITCLELVDTLHKSVDYRVGIVETVQFALDTLAIVTLVPDMYHEVCATSIGAAQRTGMSIILEASNSRNAEVVKAALCIVCNCVCPHHRVGCRKHPYKDIRHFALTSKVSSSTSASGDDSGRVNEASPLKSASSRSAFGCSCSGDDRAQRSIRKLAREKNVIKVCLQLLQHKSSMRFSDEIRLLACRALLGLVRDRPISQILEKMPLVQLLSDLIRTEPNPLVEEHAGLYMRFKEYAMELISHVTHRAPCSVLSEATDPTIVKIEKAAVVSNTTVSYSSTELLEIIRQHLQLNGLHQSAAVLQREMLSAGSSQHSKRPDLTHSNTPTHSNSNHHHASIEPGVGTPSGTVSSAGTQQLPSSSFHSPMASAKGKRRQHRIGSVPISSLSSPSTSKSSPSTSANNSGLANKTPSTGVSPWKYASPDKNSKKKHSRPSRMVPPSVHVALSNPFSSPRTPVHSPPHSAPVHVSGERPRKRQKFVCSASKKNLLRTKPSCSKSGRALVPTAPSTPHFFSSSMECSDSTAVNGQSTGSSTPSSQPQPPPSINRTLSNTTLCSTTNETVLSELDNIVIKYLREQHRKCSRPVEVVPPFSLTSQHVCPEPATHSAHVNIAARVFQRQVEPPHGGPCGAKFTRRLIHSRFKPSRSFRHDACGFTSARFYSEDRIITGSEYGEIQLHDMYTTQVVNSWEDCHSAAVTSLDLLRASSNATPSLILSSSFSSITGTSEACLWDVNNMETPRHQFVGVHDASFNAFGDKLIAQVLHRGSTAGVNSSTNVVGNGGSAPSVASMISDFESRTGRDLTLTRGLSDSDNTAVRDTPDPSSGLNRSDIFCVETGEMLSSLFDARACNNYKVTNAAFSRSDGTVLTDGVLWDIRQPRFVHKFDKLSNFGFGSFHPTRNEVLINSAVWDLRNFKLLQMVSALDQCAVRFNHEGNVLYAFRRFAEDMDRRRAKIPTTFRVLDAEDYRDIATGDIERSIFDIQIDPRDTFLLSIEAEGYAPNSSDAGMNSLCRLYEIGRKKPSESESDSDDEGDDSENGSDWDSDNGHGDEDDELDGSIVDLSSGLSSEGDGDSSDGEGGSSMSGSEVGEIYVDLSDLEDDY